MNAEQSEASRTLQDIFSITPKMLAARLQAAVGQSAGQMSKKSLADWKKIAQMPHFPEEVGEHVCGFLTETLAGILAGAWNTYSEVRKAADETLSNPSLTSTVSLTEHEFSYEATPGIDVLVNGLKLGHLEIWIEFSCTVKSLVLSLREGCVMSIRSGEALCGLDIRCGDNTVLTRTSPALDLPGVLRFHKPLRIASLSSAKTVAVC